MCNKINHKGIPNRGEVRPSSQPTNQPASREPLNSHSTPCQASISSHRATTTGNTPNDLCPSFGNNDGWLLFLGCSIIDKGDAAAFPCRPSGGNLYPVRFYAITIKGKHESKNWATNDDTPSTTNNDETFQRQPYWAGSSRRGNDNSQQQLR